MAYVQVKHRCALPYVNGAGDIWKCEECGHYWRSVAPGNPDYAGWRRLGWLGRRLRGLT